MQPTTLQLMPEISIANTYVFLCKAYHSLFVLRNTRQHYAWGYFRQQNHQQKAQF